MRRSRATAKGVLVAMGMVVLVASCSPGEERGPQAIYVRSVDGNEVDLVVMTCNGEPEAEVVETDTEVTITVISTRQNPGDGCQDGLIVTLAAPLADRVLVDGATGTAPRSMDDS